MVERARCSINGRVRFSGPDLQSAGHQKETRHPIRHRAGFAPARKSSGACHTKPLCGLRIACRSSAIPGLSGLAGHPMHNTRGLCRPPWTSFTYPSIISAKRPASTRLDQSEIGQSDAAALLVSRRQDHVVVRPPLTRRSGTARWWPRSRPSPGCTPTGRVSCRRPR